VKIAIVEKPNAAPTSESVAEKDLLIAVRWNGSERGPL
jgi:hypothetical protein